MVAAHQQATHDWWEHRRGAFGCYVSQVVLDEAAAGDAAAAEQRMDLLAGLLVLEVTDEAERLAAAIVSSGAMPVHAVRDAAHVAVAAASNMDYLLTWNCRHLANAQIIRRISAVCPSHGLGMPVICTPEELMGE